MRGQKDSGLYDAVIIGGGASGFAAAIRLKMLCPEARVLILERLEQNLKKVRATGNGRCNLAPSAYCSEAYHSRDPEACRAVFDAVSEADVMAFWEMIGLPLRKLNEGFYPLSLKAETVVFVLEHQAEHLGVEIENECGLQKAAVKKNGLFFLEAQKGKTSKTYRSRLLLFACGAKAQPALGSDGSAADILRREAYEFYPFYPALDAVHLKQHPPRLKGCRLRLALRAYDASRGLLLGEDAGEIIFNQKGISGIPLMQLSASVALALGPSSEEERQAARYKAAPSEIAAETIGNGAEPFSQDKASAAALRAGRIFPKCRPERDVFIICDFLPQYTFTEAERFLEAQFERLGANVESVLASFLPLNAAMFLDASYKLCRKKADIPFLAEFLKYFAFAAEKTAGYQQAQVCGGGLAFSNLKAGSLEFKAEPGLFAAGEILDVYGDCGGYNLLWAFASGLKAAEEMALHLRGEEAC